VICPRTERTCPHPACYQAETCQDRDGTRKLARFSEDSDPANWPPVGKVRFEAGLSNAEYAQHQATMAAMRIEEATQEIARDMEGARRMARAAQRCPACLKFECAHLDGAHQRR
jgi:hypothetical protein